MIRMADVILDWFFIQKCIILQKIGKQGKASLKLKEKLASVNEVCARLIERAIENDIIFVESRRLGWAALPELKIICVPPEVRARPLEKMQKLNREGIKNSDGSMLSWDIEADIAHEIAHIEIYELVKKFQKQGYRCICNTPCMYSEELAVKYQRKLLEREIVILESLFEKEDFSQDCPMRKEIENFSSPKQNRLRAFSVDKYYCCDIFKKRKISTLKKRFLQSGR